MNDGEFPHERLDVWHESIGYASLIYDVTRMFPNDERFGLTSQLRRAAVSISSTLAEGNGRTPPRDKMRFVEIAYGSLMETISQLQIALDQQFVSKESLADARARAVIISRMLSGLRSSLEKRLS